MTTARRWEPKPNPTAARLNPFYAHHPFSHAILNSETGLRCALVPSGSQDEIHPAGRTDGHV